MLAIFFITSADSASLVNSQLSQKGNPAPNRLITAFWALCMAGIAMVILLFGGQNALQGLQNLIVVSALMGVTGYLSAAPGTVDDELAETGQDEVAVGDVRHP